MYLQRLSLVNFKNYGQAGLELSPKFNCFTGDNGEGKTNLLDAVHYLSFCKSFINPSDAQNIMHDAPFFVIQGDVVKDEGAATLYCAVKRNEKKQFKRNQKEYSRLADHIGLYPAVVISPFDSELITEGSEYRRKFMDSIISQINRPYLDTLIKYNKILVQRNATLKRFYETRSFDKDTLEIWDDQLIEAGTFIHEKRKEFIASFIPFFIEYYQWISGNKEQAGLEYSSRLTNSSFGELLKESVPKDRAAQYTTVGIHKDDLVFLLNGHAVKKFASQGQQKSYLAALKLAQFEFLKKENKVTPMLLLDDIFDKLDQGRVEKLMELVSSDKFGQVFITDTHKNRIFNILKELNADFKLFEIKKGEVTSHDKAEK